MRVPAFIRDCVITIASDDYETFETILAGTKKLAESRGLGISEQEVADGLRAAIVQGYVEAYLLSPQPPHSRKVDYSADQLHDLWFYVTPRGKSSAKGIPELSAEDCLGESID